MAWVMVPFLQLTKYVTMGKSHKELVFPSAQWDYRNNKVLHLYYTAQCS